MDATFPKNFIKIRLGFTDTTFSHIETDTYS